jgi:hypothetical protein
MINKTLGIMNEAIESDNRDTLSESHRDYMARYIQAEIDRQEKVSERFLKERIRQRNIPDR